MVGGSVSGRRLPVEVGARFGPEGVAIDRGLSEHVELPAAGMLPQVGRRNTEAEALVRTQRPLLRDPVRHMDEAGQREWEGRIDHEGDGERKGEYVGIGRGQDVGVAESAHVRIAREVIAIDHHLRQLEGDVRQPDAVPTAGAYDRLRIETPEPGSLLEPGNRHAPRMLW